MAANLVFEPLVGELFRAKFVMRVAATRGDFVTPTLMGAGESDFERDLAYTKALVGPLVADETHGDANRDVLAEWLATWTPLSLAAAQALEPLWSDVEAGGPSFDTAFAEVRSRYEGIAEELGIPTPQEVAR